MLATQRSLVYTAFILILAVSAPVFADPNNVAADQPGQWCYTQIMFERKAANGNTTLGVEACPSYGNCDEPAVRDAFSPEPATPITYLKLYFQVMTEDNGTNAATTESYVASQVGVLNADYLPYRIQFEYDMRFVPDSDFRYLTQEYEFNQMKDLYALDPTEQINIYVATVNVGGEVYSFGTFPWDSDALGNRGGVVMNRTQFFPWESATLTHELGHNLGLYHTFRGVSETAQCGTCYEQVGAADADYRGDLCSDTPPTPLNYYCSAPGTTDPCTGFSWGPTSPQNYMSYAPTSCLTQFTPQQAGRMQCWISDHLESWIIRFDLLATPNLGEPPMTVNFQGISDRTATSWDWDFGDAGSSTLQNPTHEYTAPGYYTVGATIQTANGPYSTAFPGLVAIYADTITVEDTEIDNGQAVVDIVVRNYVPVSDLIIPISWDGPLDLRYDSASTVGLRSEHMLNTRISYVPQWKVSTLLLDGGTSNYLEPGFGPVLRLYLTDLSGGATGETPILIENYLSYTLSFTTDGGSYVPADFDGVVSQGCCQGIVGDANGDGGYEPTIGDISTLVDHLFLSRPPLWCYPEGDVNQSGGITPGPVDITIGDISLLIDHLFGDLTPIGECL